MNFIKSSTIVILNPKDDHYRINLYESAFLERRKIMGDDVVMISRIFDRRGYIIEVTLEKDLSTVRIKDRRAN